jgi:HAD superfamily hydrolase (TIGR01509 family)
MRERVSLVIFDKDGTLIDFNAMWAGWIEGLAARIEAASGLPIRRRLFAETGYEPDSCRMIPNGPLAIGTMEQLRTIPTGVLQTAGLGSEESERIIEATWTAPDPVATARPLADLAQIFETLRERDIRIAVATTDDRAPTRTTLEALGVAHLVDGLACGDDGTPIKPAPDAVLALCAALGVPPAETVVVGDSSADMRMGRAAQAGLVIGVLSGVSPREVLAPLADRVLPSIATLLKEIVA